MKVKVLKDYFEVGDELMKVQKEKIELQQENKQLKSILTELEEWLNRERNDDSEYSSYLRFTAFDETLDKIQELKEKYK